MTIRTIVSVSSVVVSIFSAQTAGAQQVAQPGDVAMSEREQSGDVAASQGQDLGDIVVTANKKAQILQKTPAAVTSLDTELIVQKGVTDLRAAQAFVPSVRFQQQATSTEVYIRGIGATLDQAQIDPPTSVNFNGIYMPREDRKSTRLNPSH